MQGQLSGIEIEEGSDDTEEGVGFDRIGDFLRIIITNITLWTFGMLARKN